MRFSALAVLLLFVAATAPALEVPPPPTRWFTDAAGLVSAAEAAALDQKLAAFEQQSGAQFIIYTFPSLENEAIEDFTIRAVERWKVGQAKYDNGLVLFVFVKERKIRIETGYGLEGSITDAFASRVIREVMAPYFQRGDWAGGLNAGADAIIQKIRTGEEPVAPLRRPAQRGEPASVNSVFFMMLLFFLIFFILPMLLRRGGCGGCILPLFIPGGVTFGGHRGGFGGGGFGGGFGGFSGGGGGFGGGGATGGW